MNVKTITASTIHAALLEARRLLGDDVVLLESVPPHGDQPARITVMTDAAPAAAVAPRPQERQRQLPAAQPRVHARPAEQAVAVHAQRASRMPGGVSAGADVAVMEEGSAGDDEPLSGRDTTYELSEMARTVLARRSGGDGTSLPARMEPRLEGGYGTARGNLFPYRAGGEGSSLPEPAAQHEALEEILREHLQVLHQRLDLIERRFDGAIIGAAQRWAVHPLFGELLNQGMRPSTLTRLFDKLATKGYQPDTNEETLRWALAQEMRRSLDMAVPKHVNGAQVFIGPSGAGKTSLLLKVARHQGFYGRRRTAVIVILPAEEDQDVFFQNPTDVYRGHGLPVTSVASLDEMRKAILRVQHFDHILIDSPPMPLNPVKARKMQMHVKRLVDPIMPLQVQFVLNTTRSLDDVDPDLLMSLPLRPDVMAFTHLDETHGWGRLADWLMTFRMPVQFVSTSPRVPDGVAAFSPTWFVEEMMKL